MARLKNLCSTESYNLWGENKGRKEERWKVEEKGRKGKQRQRSERKEGVIKVRKLQKGELFKEVGSATHKGREGGKKK